MKEVYVVTLLISNEAGLMPYTSIVTATSKTSHDDMVEAVLGRLDTTRNIVMQVAIDKMLDSALIEIMRVAIDKGLYI